MAEEVQGNIDLKRRISQEVETNVDEQSKIVRSIGDYVVGERASIPKKTFEPPLRLTHRESEHKAKHDCELAEPHSDYNEARNRHGQPLNIAGTTGGVISSGEDDDKDLEYDDEDDIIGEDKKLL